jgi:hemolysin III
MAFADLLMADETELREHYPSRAEHAADGLVHAIGIGLGVIGGGVLFALAMMHGGMSIASSAALYALCVILMLACSAIYNLTRPSRARRLLRRMDEAAIFVMIAGSYTPFVIKLLPENLEWWAVGAVWAMALAGAAGKVLAANLGDKFWCLVYLGYAWCSVALVGPTALTLPPVSLALLAAGGVIYSAGVLVYLNHAIPFRRAIWHTFVVVAAATHYGAIVTGVVLPMAS